MSTAIAICHGKFGRASLYQLDRPLTKHAHREGHLTFHVKGESASISVCDEHCALTPCQGVAVNPWQMHDFNPGNFEQQELFLVLYIKPMWFLDFNRSSNTMLRFGAPRIEVDDQLSRLVSRVVSLLINGSDTDLLDGYLYDLTEKSFEQSHRWPTGAYDLELLGATCMSEGGNGDGRSFSNEQPFHGEKSIAESLYDNRLRRSITLMTDHIGTDMDMDWVARESGLSRPHFFKLFRKQTGLTPNLFMNTLRMERAIDSLIETELSVSDIGYDLGFSSQSSFTRFFSSNVGMAPTGYRRVAHFRHS